MYKGHVILSHGLDSGPDASKVSAMAEVAERLGWRVTRPNYRDLDAVLRLGSVVARIERMKLSLEPGERLVLAGSSLGAFTSGLMSLQISCAGLFLVAPPISISEFERPLAVADVPLAIVHGWNDELIPANEVIAFAQSRSAWLTLVNDTHRLSEHINLVANQFALFLTSLR